MDFLIVFAAKYLFLASLLLLVYFFFTLKNQLRKKFAIFTFASFTLAYLLAKLLGSFLYNPRPFVSDQITPLVAHAADNGFPSDHTLLTATIAAVVIVYNRKLGLVLFTLSIAVGFARVLAGIHHPIDIIGAVAIAIGAVLIVRKFLILGLFKFDRNQFEGN